MEQLPYDWTPLTPDPKPRCVPRDSVDHLLASWGEVRPDLDFSPVGVIGRLARVRGHVDAELAEMFAANGLTAPVFGVLVTLARLEGAEGVSQRRLMEELGLTSGTISVRMTRLEEQGLVERRGDPGDKRNSLVAMTPAGRELYERVVPAHLENERRLLAALDPDEEEQLAGLLRKLLVEFEGSRPDPDAQLQVGVALAPAHVALRMRAELGLPSDPGLLVRSVAERTPADEAGLRPGDVLRRAGGRPLTSVAALYSAIEDAGTDGTLRLKILRGVNERTVTLRLGAGAVTEATRSASTAGRSARDEHLV